jgi:O-antigen/teichoic acid export membrane protein
MKNEGKLAFFRQSGWLVIANTGAGAFLAAVHWFASRLPQGEWGIFLTLLRLFMVLSIPAAGLQIIMAQQTAAAVDPERRRLAAQMLASVVKATFVLWLLMVVLFAFWQERIVAAFSMPSVTALWVTLVCALAALWLPIFQGTLQGIQEFFWLGNSLLMNGIGRFAGMALIIIALKGNVAGAMTGTLLGIAGAAAIAYWPARKLLAEGWNSPAWKLDWAQWLKMAAPLTFGAGSILLLMNSDMLLVSSHFSKPFTDYYGGAAMIGVALVTFTTPMAAVMFPKLVRSFAQAEESSALALALKGTAALGLAGALFCTFLPELPLRIMFFNKPEFLKSAPLVPWFMWSMLPLTVANVLIGNLLARKLFAAVPWLAAISIGYVATLYRFVNGPHSANPFIDFVRVIQILGVFSILMLAVAAFFTWRASRNAQGKPGEAR